MILYPRENDGEKHGDSHRHRAECPEAAQLVERAWQADEEADERGECAERDGACCGVRERVEQLGADKTVQCCRTAVRQTRGRPGSRREKLTLDEGVVQDEHDGRCVVRKV